MKRIEQQITSLPYQTVLFTYEGFSGLDDSSIVALKNWLDQFFEDFRIVVYLRRQPELQVSLYSQLHKGAWLFKNHFAFDIESRISANYISQHSQYQELLDRWSAVFGKEKVAPRIFDRKEMVQNDLIADFCAAIEIDENGLERVPSLNESLDAEATEFCRLLTPYLPLIENSEWKMPRGEWSVRMEKLFGKSGNKGYHLNREQAEAIVDYYRESNNAVAREYFGREQLFSDDVSMYPEETKPHHLTVEKCAEITAVMWKDLYATLEETRNALAETQHEAAQLKKKQRKRLLNRTKRLLKKIRRFPLRAVRTIRGKDPLFRKKTA
ncbi:MAG: hypothetical protein LBQ54_00280 [Planctomycetaceae bacterium]|nr:hypothetical protein [Planctomycetaceae bacterium]